MATLFKLDTFYIDPSLVAVHIDAETAIDVVTHLAEVFIKQGYVKPTYTAAAIHREQTSPTGLPTNGVGTAIPHAGIEHTIKPGIVVGTLVHPVKFGELGDPDNQVDVGIIFMLSVTEPETQVYLLQSLIEVYKDEQLLLRLQAATDPDVIVQEVNAALEQISAGSA